MSELMCVNQDALHEECGVFAVCDVESAAQMIYYGLHSLQHRGQEGTGIAVFNGTEIHRQRGPGLVTETYTPPMLDALPGHSGIGHVRYATAGGLSMDNVQPLLVRSHLGDYAVAHNGNIVNAHDLRVHLEDSGSIFQTSSDTEILGHLIQRQQGSFTERLQRALPQLVGAFSFVIVREGEIYGMRDKFGFRPLSLGRLDDGYILSSETCAFDIIGAEFIRDIKPGEIVHIGKHGLSSMFYDHDTSPRMCAMEYIYFSRPDSTLEGVNVHLFRRVSGNLLAQESPADVDMVVGIPDSSLSAAMGYADMLDKPYEMGLIKNRYVGRTFIAPTQKQRERGVRMKLSALRAVVGGKRVALVDDSIVRGTTSRHIVQLLKDAGATQVHVRIASPPLISPCFYGVDMPTFAELISANKNPQQVAETIGADSIAFLSLDALQRIANCALCTTCFTGQYPTSLFGQLEALKR